VIGQKNGERMSDFLLDSGVLIRHLRDQNGYPELINRLMDEAIVHISAMTRLEIVRGMKKRERRATFDLLDSLETIPMTSEIADHAGEFIRSWRERGITLGDADAVIAASALYKNLALVTTNSRHFPMPDLVVLQADEQGHLTQTTR
jgi:predicted nucleic acid-binding protein